MKDAVYYERYMNEALKEAKKAYEKKEVPIGAVDLLCIKDRL